MKHPGPAALSALEPLLLQLRLLPQLKERSRGVFYLRARSFLHFHEDPAGLFADLRHGEGFKRCPVGSAEQQAALLNAVRVTLCLGSSLPG